MRRLVLLLSVGALLGCPGDDSTTSDTASTQTGTPTTTGPSTDTDDPSSTDATGPGMTSGSSSGSTGADSSGSGPTDTGTATDTGPGVMPPCGFEQTLCMLAEGKVEPMDCGTVTLEDDAAAWDAAANCAADAAAGQNAFKVAFQLPSKDSFIFDGYYGTVGFVYGLGRVYTDTFGDPMLGSYTCTDVVLMPGCQPDVATHCLECVEQSDVNPLPCEM